MKGSLSGRLLAVATIALLAFLGLTGYALDRAFQNRTQLFYRNQLQSQVYGLLAAADLDPQGELRLSAPPPEPRLRRPDSGLYAEIADASGNFVWRSGSSLGRGLPTVEFPAMGISNFNIVTWRDGEALFLFQQAVAYENSTGIKPFVIRVAESLRAYRAEVETFRATILIWLGGAGILLLVLQTLLLRWTLAPLRDVVTEVGAVERGEKNQLDRQYPRELRMLTRNFNAFLESERRQRERYRDALADLAHSLKTPLAVIQALVEKSGVAGKDREEVAQNVERMRDIIDYQLQRAVAAGRATLIATPVAVLAQVKTIADALQKVYADKNVDCEIDVPETASFFGEVGDLTEVLGNLLDNAFKWSTGRTRIRARSIDGGAGQRSGLVITIEDDGPGVPDEMKNKVIRRGVRHDSRIVGQGIGLAVVAEIVSSYGGQVELGRSGLGGAQVTVSVPAA